jgi:dCMP deaminase
MNWHLRYLELASHVAGWSKDPSMKVGAVITRPDNTVASLGFNGYPRGVDDVFLEHRDYKMPRIIHAEMNAILSANEPLKGYNVYVTHPTCSHCAGGIIQAGIKNVFIDNGAFDGLSQKWLDSFHISKTMYQQARVGVHYYYTDGRSDYDTPWHVQQQLHNLQGEMYD